MTVFTGDKKAPMVSPLAAIEKQFIQALAGRFPFWIKSYHLTLLTLLWSAGTLGFGYLARENLQWLWGASAMLVLQWFTDCFDGALGRLREEGLAKWGYYMDHFLDFIFMWCVPVAYAFLLSPDYRWWVFVWAFLYGALMVHSFLDFSVTQSFRITYLGLGPTEIRLAYIILNTAIIYGGVGWLEVALPWGAGILAVGLAVVVWQGAWAIWSEDRKNRPTRVPNPASPRSDELVR